MQGFGLRGTRERNQWSIVLEISFNSATSTLKKILYLDILFPLYLHTLFCLFFLHLTLFSEGTVSGTFKINDVAK